MFRLRRYRVYMIIAAVALLLLYRMSQETDWESLSTPIDYTKGQKPNVAPASADQQTKHKPLDVELDLQRKRPQEPQKPLKNSDTGKPPVKIPELKDPLQEDKQKDYTLPDKKPASTATDAEKAAPKKNTGDVPDVIIPDRKPPHQQWEEDANKEKEEAALRTKTTTLSKTSTSTIHWSKPTENFPISSDSIISLPTGKPKSVPSVQYAFKEETAATRQKREERLAQVKAEMERAWTGYRTYAWMHDELSPVSHKFRDPFCGWAATLVDALDTLWIMGMKDEFEEAVKAVGDIDFTVATRNEIPVFETTIRYLGGFLSAYDVSGGHDGGHKILLDKAVELAEILMGVFDTPNRMPILYYGWTPASMKRPRRAATSANVAELGSLAMEFTRLAQLTKENKYYDAVARITDALEEWQSRPHGTSFPGIFPEMVDASGCNATAAREARSKFFEEQTAKAQEEQAQVEAQTVLDTPDDYTGREYDHVVKTNPSKKLDAESNLAGTPNLAGSGDLAGSARLARAKALNRRSVADDASDKTLTTKQAAKEFTAPLINSAPDLYQQMREDQVTGEPYTIKELGNDVCYPQGLTAGGWGRQTYGMGGGQDSTYEYFPKMYLLLGGLEPKYQDMHLKVAAAVKKWLLYRPMVPDNRDILFSARLSTTGNPEKDVISEFEVTHLTCFLGGMFGMAGKIFEEPVDVEVGKKLAEGCVWAYGATPTGIMPEGAAVVPCAETTNCEWNETLWHQYLDPLWNSRQDQIEDWYKRQAEYERMQAEAEAEGAKWDEEQRQKAEQVGGLAREPVSGAAEVAGPALNSDQSTTTTASSGAQKRHVEASAFLEQLETSSNDNSPTTRTSEKSSKTVKEAGADSIPSSKFGSNGRNAKAQTPIFNDQLPAEQPRRPNKFELTKPLSHEEFVESRLKNEHIPPGFTNINSRSYILRPEAIESVWYMYRITGDTTWQDKGWEMFESIIAATQTEAGHSAIKDVLVPGAVQSNEMESFWLAETLKYFYLLYSSPDVISLDDWVLNTEAHPFRRPDASAKAKAAEL